MREEDYSIYLANIIYVARADGVVSAQEQAAIEEIRQNISAKKTDLSKAQKIVEAPGFSPKSIGTFGQQVTNLEDMIYIALADNILGNQESAAILAYAQQIGLTQEQIDKIMCEAEKRRASGIQVCPSCNQNVEAGAKFCPHCGKPLAQIDSDQTLNVTLEVPLSGYSIEFCESTSTYFTTALEIAKNAPIFKTCIRNKKTWYLANWPKDAFAPVINLASSLGGLKNRKLYIDAQEQPWDEVFAFCWCAKQREAAYQPVTYCFGVDDKRLNLWGCKHARMDWQEWGDWFSYGSFKKSGVFKKQIVWTFDKAKIRHVLNANLHPYRFCPHLRPRLIEAVLVALPDEIEMPENKDWKFKRHYEETPESIKVTEQETSNGVTFTNEYYTDGVVPRGLAVARKIFAAAFALAGTTDITIERLTS